MLAYKVAKKYLKGPEQIIAQFKEHADAKSYINQKLQQDIALSVHATYLLYDMGELTETFDHASAEGGGDEGGSGGGQKQSSSFRPSPLQVAPRPPGMPPSSFKDEDDIKK